MKWMRGMTKTSSELSRVIPPLHASEHHVRLAAEFLLSFRAVHDGKSGVGGINKPDFSRGKITTSRAISEMTKAEMSWVSD